MGIYIQQIKGAGPKLEMNKEKTLARGWVWAILRKDPNTGKNGRQHDWHLQGVATSEEGAIRMCLDEHYVIGPIPLDTALPIQRIEWAGSYFPLANPIEGK